MDSKRTPQFAQTLDHIKHLYTEIQQLKFRTHCPILRNESEMAMRAEIADMAREVARLQSDGFEDAKVTVGNAWNLSVNDDNELAKELENNLKLTKREFPQLLPKPLPKQLPKINKLVAKTVKAAASVAVHLQPPPVAPKQTTTTDNKIPVAAKAAAIVQEAAATPAAKPLKTAAVVQAPAIPTQVEPSVVEAQQVADVVKTLTIVPDVIKSVSKPPGFAGPPGMATHSMKQQQTHAAFPLPPPDVGASHPTPAPYLDDESLRLLTMLMDRMKKQQQPMPPQSYGSPQPQLQQQVPQQQQYAPQQNGYGSYPTNNNSYYGPPNGSGYFGSGGYPQQMHSMMPPQMQQPQMPPHLHPMQMQHMQHMQQMQAMPQQMHPMPPMRPMHQMPPTSPMHPMHPMSPHMGAMQSESFNNGGHAALSMESFSTVYNGQSNSAMPKNMQSIMQQMRSMQTSPALPQMPSMQSMEPMRPEAFTNGGHASETAPAASTKIKLPPHIQTLLQQMQSMQSDGGHAALRPDAVKVHNGDGNTSAAEKPSPTQADEEMQSDGEMLVGGKPKKQKKAKWTVVTK